MSKLKILVTRGDYDPRALEPITSDDRFDVEIPDKDYLSHDELLSSLRGKHGAFVNPMRDVVDAAALDAAGPQLKVVSSFSVGLDHIDLTACKERGVRVGNLPGLLSDAVAEMTVALTLMTMLETRRNIKTIYDDTWKNDGPFTNLGFGIEGKTIGIFGLGGSGTEFAKRIRSFKPAAILYTSRTQKAASVEAELGVKYVSFSELLSSSDVVVCLAALNQSTKGVFDAAAFAKMKKTAVFINVSRGGLVNQPDLVETLNSRTIFAAGLDVMTPEPLPSTDSLFSSPHVTLTPHMATKTIDIRLKMGAMAMENLVQGLTGGKMPAEVKC